MAHPCGKKANASARVRCFSSPCPCCAERYGSYFYNAASRKNSKASNLNSAASNLNFMARSFCGKPCGFSASKYRGYNIGSRPRKMGKSANCKHKKSARKQNYLQNGRNVLFHAPPWARERLTYASRVPLRLHDSARCRNA